MADKKLNVDLALQNADKFEKFVDSLVKSNQLVESMSKKFSSVFAQIASLNKETKDLELSLAKASGNRPLGQVGQLLGRGSPTSFLKNATVSGDIKNFEASMTQVFARLNNRFAKGLSDAVKAVQSQEILNLSRTRQTTPSGNIQTLANQITAQQGRLANAQISGDSAATIAKEAAALDALKAARVQLLDLQKQSNVSDNIALSNQQKMNALVAEYRITKLAAAGLDKDDVKAQQANQLQRASIIVSQQQLRVEQERNAAQGVYTEGLAKQEARLGQVLNLENQIKASNSIRIAAANQEAKLNQLQADGGASLFKVQSQLLVNYGLMGAALGVFQFGTRYVVDLNKALIELQAITVTTDAGMKELTKTILDVSQNSRFTAVDVAKAATVLGQAGFSAKQIEQSIGPIVQFATAVGEDLSKAVDVASTVISVFNLNTTEMTHVVNVLTGALNLSKLNIDKLASGIQYSGNIANEMGINFEELVSVLGALSDAGIKSGSTMGTGLRQLLTELENPSKKLVAQLKAVGLTFGDVNVQTLGFTTVIENLANAGFNSANAFKGLDIRAAATYLALKDNTQEIRDINEQVLLGNAAVEANAKQMGSIANSITQLKNVFGIFANTLSGPFANALTGVVQGMATLLQTLNQVPGLVSVLGTGLLAVFSGVVLTRIGSLVGSLAGFGKLFGGLGSTIKLTTAAFFEAEGAMGVLAVASRGLLTAFGPIGLIIAAISAGFAIFGQRGGEAARAIDELQNKVDQSQGVMKETAERIESVDQEVQRLTDRYSDFKKNSASLSQEVLNMQLKFGAFSTELATGAITTVDQLIEAMKNLRKEMATTNAGEIQKYLNNQTLLVREKARQLGQNSDRQADKADVRGGFYLNSQNPGYANRYESTLPGIGSTFDNTIAANKTVSSIASFVQNFNADTATEEQRQEIEKKLGDARAAIILQQNALSKQAVVLDDTADKNTSQYTEINNLIIAQNKGLEQSLSQINDIQSRVLQTNETKRQEIQAQFQSTDAYKDLSDYVTDKQKLIADAQNRERDAKTPEAKKKIQEEIAGYVDDLNKFASDIEAGVLASRTSAFADQVPGGTSALNFISKYIPTLNTNTSGQNPLKTIAGGLGPNATKGDIAIAGQPVAAAARAAASAGANTIASISTDLGKGAKDYFDKITEVLKANIEKVKRTVEIAADKFNNQIAVIDQTVQAAQDKDHGPTRFKYGDTDIEKLNDQKYQLQIQGAQATLEAINNALPIVKQLVDREAALNAQAQAKYAANPNDPNAIKNAAGTLRDLNSAQDQYRELSNKQITTQAQLNAAYGKTTEEQMSMGESLQFAIGKYMEQKQITSDLRLNMQKNVTEVLDNATDAFATFSSTVLSGSGTVKSAFQSMAQSILQSLLKIATNKLASSLFSNIFGLIGGGSQVYSSAIGPTQIASSTGFFGLNLGGSIRRAATGYGVPNRDSVPILARPGEYILRNSAVDMIGKDNLDKLNAAGNTRISKSTSDMPNAANMVQPAVPAPINLYVVTPEQQPPLGKNDILLAVTKDMIKGGSTAKAVKQVMR